MEWLSGGSECIGSYRFLGVRFSLLISRDSSVEKRSDSMSRAQVRSVSIRRTE